ncbi:MULTISPECIES: phosphatase PAP2 family protein [unclassified Streptomyces]|uniref:phosphatase PAP2 family protein n=1 Tax=unclassified Streptomyces TaxID=2593676 RepID=UPI002E810E07|nr:phosphatase PAP2 family protein [Streptomyces sp. NBC_00589]WTI41134.1 phosphatase PAP2 family protein [Streptomyces sp. NBC_00775]WUB25182.1 phosphatase PAP2 family protein [Streptomyces sp. NBC_00589]
MHSPPVDSPSPAPGPHTPGPRAAALTAATLAVPSVVLLLLVAFSWHPLLALDGDIARTTHTWAVDNPGATHVFRILTDWVWDPWTLRAVCAAAVIWLLWIHSAWWLALWVVATCVLGTLVQQGLKSAVGRERPVWPDPVDSAHYAAFPSGHALTATVVCGLLLWLLRLHGAGHALRRTASALAVVSVVGVGLTRVWLGVHWPSDVLGGWLIGALIVALAVASYERWPGARRP